MGILGIDMLGAFKGDTGNGAKLRERQLAYVDYGACAEI